MQFVTFNAPFHSQKGDNDPPPPLKKGGMLCFAPVGLLVIL